MFSDAMEPLIKYVYTKSGRAISARMNETHLRSNGYSKVVDELLEATSDFSDMTFTERLRMFVFDKIHLNHCKTCGTELRVWKGNDWKSFCSMSCAQNDPDNKARMLAGQSNVDWSEKVKKREETMQEVYGYKTYSQTEDAKQKFAERTKEAWANPEKKTKRIEKRIETNIERYGVEHTSQRQEQRIISGQAISKTYQEKSEDRKSIHIDEYRKARLNPHAYEVLTNRELLEDLYLIRKMSVVGIARHLNCAEGSVVFAIHSHGILYEPSRYSVTSDIELKLFSFVNSVNPDAISTYKDGKHLDVFIPRLKLGFEFNGVYWHSEAKKTRYYHAEKVEYFYDRGIRYVQIWEDDWINNQGVVKRFIRNLLGQNNRIGARKTSVVELSQSEFSAFMDEHHMQGSTSAGIRLGLVYDDKLVAAMGFKNVASNVTSVGKTAELVRFANINVTGAFTKLLKHFERNFDYEYIKSFADLEIVDKRSNVYSKHGFVAEDVIEPDYRYYNYRTGMREHKFGYRKSTFQKLGFDIDNKTERELALEYGLLRCYDSGKIKYTKKIERN